MLARVRVTAAIAAAALVAVAATSASASFSVRPAPGTPDPRYMVLTSADLGGAKVTSQRYFRDTDFPSVISYVRELENGSIGDTPLPYVESQAEIGRSAALTASFLAALKRFFTTKDARELIADSFAEEIGSNALITSLQIGRPRALGIGRGSFDLLVTARLLGRPVDFHIAAFRLERVLGIVTVVGAVGRRVSLTAMRRLATVMAAKTIVELVPQNIALPSVSGSPAVGQTLTASPGRWTGNPARYSYRWERCMGAGAGCGAIPGGTRQTYVVSDIDVGATLRVAVSARGALASEAATSSPTSIVAVFIDTFDASSLSTSWSVFTTGAGPRAVQANGQLEVTLPAGTSLGPGGYANAAVMTTCRLPGDFDMQLEYTLLSGLLPTDGITAGFDAAEFTGDAWSGSHGLFVANLGGSHRLTTHFPHPGVFGLPYNDFVLDSARSGTLRLVRTTRAGVTTITASRLTGGSWSFTSQPYGAPTSQAAQIYAFTNLAPFPTEVRVAFDNFRINSGTLSCP